MAACVIQTADLAYDDGTDADQGVAYKTRYLVGFTGDYSAAAILLNSGAGLPKRLAGRSDDPRVYAARIKVQLADNEQAKDDGTTVVRIAWYDVDWAQKSITFDPNPFNRKPEIVWDGTDVTEYKNYDLNSKPIMTTAREMLDPGLPAFVHGGDCTVTRNERLNPATVVCTYSNSLNSSTWFSVPALQGWMHKLQSSQVTESVSTNIDPSGSITYWRTSYPMSFKLDETWRTKAVDAGLKSLGSDGKAHPIKIDGRDIDKPVLLDGSGQPLILSGGPPFSITKLEFVMLPEVDWNALILPNIFA